MWWNIVQPQKGMEFWQMLQYGWNLETSVWHKRPNIEVFWIEKFIEPDSRMLVTKDWGKEGIRGYCLVSTEFLFEMIKKF